MTGSASEERPRDRPAAISSDERTLRQPRLVGVIRTADAGDAPELARLRHEMTAEDDPGVTPLVEFAASFVPWAIEAMETRRWLVHVAELDGRVVGSAWLQLIDRVPRPRVERPRIAYLTNVFVEAAHRNEGLGAALLSAAAAAAKREGSTLVAVWPSDRSVPLYRRAGFDLPPDPFLQLMLDHD